MSFDKEMFNKLMKSGIVGKQAKITNEKVNVSKALLGVDIMAEKKAPYEEIKALEKEIAQKKKSINGLKGPASKELVTKLKTSVEELEKELKTLEEKRTVIVQGKKIDMEELKKKLAPEFTSEEVEKMYGPEVVEEGKLPKDQDMSKEETMKDLVEDKINEYVKTLAVGQKVSIPKSNAKLVYHIDGEEGEEFGVANTGTMIPPGRYRVVKGDANSRNVAGQTYSNITVEKIEEAKIEEKQYKIKSENGVLKVIDLMTKDTIDSFKSLEELEKKYGKVNVEMVDVKPIGESTVNEEEVKDTMKILARGISNEDVAKKLAQEKGGSVIADVDDQNKPIQGKFRVVANESVISEREEFGPAEALIVKLIKNGSSDKEIIDALKTELEWDRLNLAKTLINKYRGRLNNSNANEAKLDEAKFKRLDRVVAIKRINDHGNVVEIGTKGIVRDISNDSKHPGLTIEVKFDGIAREWFVKSNEIELVPTSGFKPSSKIANTSVGKSGEALDRKDESKVNEWHLENGEKKFDIQFIAAYPSGMKRVDAFDIVTKSVMNKNLSSGVKLIAAHVVKESKLDEGRDPLNADVVALDGTVNNLKNYLASEDYSQASVYANLAQKQSGIIASNLTAMKAAKEASANVMNPVAPVEAPEVSEEAPVVEESIQGKKSLFVKLESLVNQALLDGEVDHKEAGEIVKQILSRHVSGTNESKLEEKEVFAGWIAIFNGKKLEIKKDVDAKDLWSAKLFAANKLNVPKSKMGLLAIEPAYEDVVEGKLPKDFDMSKAETMTDLVEAKKCAFCNKPIDMKTAVSVLTGKKGTYSCPSCAKVENVDESIVEKVMLVTELKKKSTVVIIPADVMEEYKAADQDNTIIADHIKNQIGRDAKFTLTQGSAGSGIAIIKESLTEAEQKLIDECDAIILTEAERENIAKAIGVKKAELKKAIAAQKKQLKSVSRYDKDDAKDIEDGIEELEKQVKDLEKK